MRVWKFGLNPLAHSGPSGIFYNPSGGIAMARAAADDANEYAEWADILKGPTREIGGIAVSTLAAELGGPYGLYTGAAAAGAWDTYCDLEDGISPTKAILHGLKSGAGALIGGAIIGGIAEDFGFEAIDAAGARSENVTGLNSPADLNGVERASPELMESMSSKGRRLQVAEAGSDDERYLDYRGAEANVGDVGYLHILHRPDPSKAALLEEYLHGTQYRFGIIDRIGESGAEVHVKDFMIRHQRMLRLSAEDVDILHRLRDLEIQRAN